MAHVIADRVRETTITTGTGALALGGATTAYRTFASVMSVADTCYYAIEAVDANGVATGDWEVGLGTYSALSTLTRTTPSASSNAGAAVNFAAGTKNVWVDVTAVQIGGVVGGVITATTRFAMALGGFIAWGSNSAIKVDADEVYDFRRGSAGSTRMRLSTATLTLPSTGLFAFSSTTDATGTVDLAAARNAAGVVEVNNGTAGTFRDLLTRNTITSGAAQTAAAGRISWGATTQTTVGAAGAASALPLTPAGYIIINVAGTDMVLPYYAKA